MTLRMQIPQPFTSPILDYYLQTGIAATRLTTLSLTRPDLEIRIRNGKLMAGYRGEEETCSAGRFGIEPLADDWEALGELMAALPHREDEKKA